MPTFSFGRAGAAALALVALAAPAAHAQWQPRFQVEASLDHTGSASMSSVIAEAPQGGFERRQKETVRYSVGASALARIAPRTSLRVGLSLASRGFAERTTEDGRTSENEVDFVYLGAPLTLGFNLINPGRGLKPFVEAGVVPELLVRQDESGFDYDLRSVGLSYLVGFGVKYNLEGGRALVLAPELRIAARDYSHDTPGTLEFRPISTGIKLGFQF
ncbi:MAG TPA: outer membrane beta-barrel protein [Longimicrobium sp.]